MDKKQHLRWKPLTALAPLLVLTMLLAACAKDDEAVAEGREAATTIGQVPVKFNTYINRVHTREGAPASATTRGGEPGPIDTRRLMRGTGFGVFAYQTTIADDGGNTSTTYNDYRTRNVPGTRRYPNFLYNEHISWDTDQQSWQQANDTTTHYWPTPDNDDTPAYVSFFAYAPYTAEGSHTSIPGITAQQVAPQESLASGVVAFSSPTFNGGSDEAEADNERQKYSDPYLQYRLAADTTLQVDLLWGTSGIDHATAAPVAGNNGQRPPFLMNTELTAENSDSVVCFLFKHALSQIGGATGLMVVLDVDKPTDSDLGGILPPYAEGATDQTPYNTKVTLHSVTIESQYQLAAPSTDATLEPLSATALFNLATGEWSDHEATDAPLVRRLSVPLAPSVAEPASFATAAYTRERFEELPLGVTTVPTLLCADSLFRPLFFIPDTYPVLDVTVDYTVRSYDPQLAQHYSEVRQQATKRLCVTEAMRLNKRYNLLLHIALTGISVTASVADWEDANAASPTGATVPVGLIEIGE